VADRAPVKYNGLSYTEIWISEAQERMVLSVSPQKWDEFEALCRSEGVEATVIGQFKPTSRLRLKYGDHQVADLAMKLLHDGRPPVVREAVYAPPTKRPFQWTPASTRDHNETLLGILGSLTWRANIGSCDSTITRYKVAASSNRLSALKTMDRRRRRGATGAQLRSAALSSAAA